MADSRWKRGLVEFLAIFLGVSLSFLAEDWRESLSQTRQGDAVLRGIERDLSQEREAIRLTLARDSLAVIAGGWLYANWSREDAPRDSIDLMLNALVGIGPTLTVRAAYESAKASGRLDFISDDQLRAAVVAFYEQQQVDFVDMAALSMDYVFEMNRALRPYVELSDVAAGLTQVSWAMARSWTSVTANTDVRNAIGESTVMRSSTVAHAQEYLANQGALLAAVTRATQSQ